jgi:hypothetical protein
MFNKKLLSFIIVFLFISFFLSSREISFGRIKLHLHENIGRFTPFYLTDIRGENYKPFFVSEDPRTSYISLSVDNKVYRLGDSGAFSLDTEISSDSAAYIWSSNSLTIHQTFTFIASKDASLADGLKMTLAITNNSETSLSVGVRFLIDTYLGEDSNTHFITEQINTVTAEKTITPGSDQEYWLSKENVGDDFGLRWEIYNSGITKPDKVIFANWKRLTESTWNYETNSGRNFNLLPYSINDSAAAMFYMPQKLSKGQTRTIVTAFGNDNKSGFTASQATEQNVLNSIAAEGNENEGTEPSLREDLLAVNNLIQKINDILSPGKEITQEQIEVLDKALKRLEQRKQAYK